MTWIDNKDDFDTSGGRLKSNKQPAERRPSIRTYTVDEVARIFKVSKRTVFKWMDGGVIPGNAWYRVPGNGYIRIDEWIILKLLNPTK